MRQNNETIEQLFRAYYGRMYRLAVSLLHDEEESRDVVNDVFLKIMTGKRELPDDNVEGYLLISVRNRCLDIISHQRVRERLQHLLTLDTQPSLLPVDSSERLYQEINEAIDTRLTPQTRLVIRMRMHGRMTYREIADELGISEAAVYKHLAQAIGRLKEHFNPPSI